MKHLSLGRRKFLLCTACTVSSLHPAVPQVSLTAETQGCFLSAPRQEHALSSIRRSNAYTDGWNETTGDPEFDRALGRALIKLSNFFDQQPAFGIVGGQEHNNAFAMANAGPGAMFGTVGFGSTMLQHLKEVDPSGMSIMAIVAHEFAHISQYQDGQIMSELNMGQNNVRRTELHADYLTGCYLGWIKRNEPRVSVRLAGRFMESIGDTNFSDPSHHGTPQERLQSVEAGFNLAINEDLRYEQYFQRGKNFILRNF